nr:MAG TPA: hypothetical protein [Caudoviricetes sp.]
MFWASPFYFVVFQRDQCNNNYNMQVLIFIKF